MTSEELHQAFVSAFGWLTREMIVGGFIGVAALLILLGLVFTFARPRAIGLLLTVLGLWVLAHAWMWYGVANITRQKPVLIILVCSMAGVNWLILWASLKPTAHETGQRAPLRIVAVGTLLLALYHVTQYMLWSMPHDPLPISYYWAAFLLPVLLLGGFAFVAAGTVFALIKRARTKAPARPIEMP